MAAPPRVAEDHKSWAVDAGAPGAIRAMAQTRDGFLWLGSASGLYRFDGLSFEAIPRIPGDRTRAMQVTALLSARNGELWVGYDYGGLAVFRGGRLHDANHGKPAGRVEKIVQAKDGAVWVQTRGKDRPGLWRYQDGVWDAMNDAWGLPAVPVADVVAPRSGGLWVATPGALYRLAPGARRFMRSDVKLGLVSGFGEAPDGRVWIDDDTGPRQVLDDGHLGPQIATLKGGGARFLVDRQGAFWSIRGGDIVKLEPVSPRGPARVTGLGVNDGLTAKRAFSLFEDAEGNVWVGTYFGLDRFRRSRIHVIADSPAKGGDGMQIAPKPGGGVYVTTAATASSIELDGRRQAIIPFAKLFESTALCARDGKVFASAGQELIALETGAREQLVLPGVAPTSQLTGCAFDGLGRTWVSVYPDGLFRRSGATWERVAIFPDRPTLWPLSMVNGRDGRIFMSFSLRALVEIGKDGQARPIWSAPNISIGMLKTTRDTSLGLLVGGDLGLARLKGDKADILQAERFAWLGNVTGLVEQRETVWLLSNAGLVSVPSAELGALFDSGRAPTHLRLYGIEDGVPGLVYSYGPRDLVEDETGRLWMVTNQGVAWLDTRYLAAQGRAPPVVIKALSTPSTEARSGAFGSRRLDVRVIDGASGVLRLAPKTHQVQFDFAVLNFAAPRSTQVRYRLKGREDWIDAGERRQVVYSGLGPGRYRFEVIAANADGLWNRDGGYVDFVIAPTFVQSWPFKVLLGVAVLITLALAYRWRMRQVAGAIRLRADERVRERLRIARDLHDSLLQNVQALILKLQAFAAQAPPGSTDRAELERALGVAGGVVEEARGYVSELRSTNAAGHFDERLHLIARQVVEDTDIDLEVRVNGAPRPLRDAVVEEVLRIVREALLNTRQHAEASRLIVELDYRAWSLRIRVSDNGKGIAPVIVRDGGRDGHFGLPGMRERAERIAGNLVIASTPGGGASVTLTLPARRAYA